MKKSWQFHTLFILFLFLLPILIIHFPGPQQPESRQAAPDTGRLVYAANLFDYEEEAEESDPVPVSLTEAKGDVLMYFTHSHEAFAPIVKAKHGKVAVFHEKDNIMSLGAVFSSHFKMNGHNLDVLNYDNGGASSKGHGKVPPPVAKHLAAKK